MTDLLEQNIQAINDTVNSALDNIRAFLWEAGLTELDKCTLILRDGDNEAVHIIYSNEDDTLDLIPIIQRDNNDRTLEKTIREMREQDELQPES